MIGVALLVFTVITVAASFISLGVAGNVTLALIIATMKGSMVAAVFMHLNHEKPWIYGSLVLTVGVLRRPDVGADLHDAGSHRHADRTRRPPPAAPEAGHEGH